MSRLPDPPPRISLPPRCAVSPEQLIEVATRTNLAHAALGTRLVEVDGLRVTIGVNWRPELAGRSPGVAPGAIAELLDHAGALAALVSLPEVAAYGGTLSLHVERLSAARPQAAVCATAERHHVTGRTLHVHAIAHHVGEQDEPLAWASCVVALR